MISLTINGQTLDVPEGYTVLKAAETLGITIPTLCYHKDLSPFGGCRLCVVEVQGARLPMTSCVLPVSPGLVVQTDTPTVIRYRQAILRILLSNYYDAGYKQVNGKNALEEENELFYWARYYGLEPTRYMASKPRYPIDSDPNPFVWVDRNKCIQCTRCVRACAEVQGRFVWSQSYRGYRAHIVAGADTTMLQGRCESCGACVAYCPTGALDNKMSLRSGVADRRVRTTCPYCGVGCQLVLEVKDDLPGGRVLRVVSHKDSTFPSVNGRHLCVKGRYGYEFIHSEQRLTKPKVRRYLLEGTPRPTKPDPWVEVDWETALDLAASGLFRLCHDFGPQSVGILASGKNTNEENYLLNKLARQALGTNNIDCYAHLYHPNPLEGLDERVGVVAMTNTFEDIENHAASLLVVNSNLTEQHPVFGAHLRQSILRRKVKMVVINPDFTNLAEFAALALYPHPHTEAEVLNALMAIIVEKGWADPTYVARDPRGFETLRHSLERYTPAKAAQKSGVAVEALYRAAEILALNRPTAALWSVGLHNHSHTHKYIQALVNLQLLLGNLERPGGGLNPLGGQNNIQGAYDMGCLPQWLPGYRRVSQDSARQPLEQAWGTSLPTQTGMSASQMLYAAEAGSLKGLYLFPEEFLGASEIDAQIRKGLAACQFVVMQAIQPWEVSRYADVLLPGVSFAEKEGTFTSIERRVQRVHAAIRPIGEARPDWEIIAALGRRLLTCQATKPVGPFAGWNYRSAEEIFAEIAALIPIYHGITYARLDQGERLHWPVESPESPGLTLLPLGYFSRGEVHFSPAA